MIYTEVLALMKLTFEQKNTDNKLKTICSTLYYKNYNRGKK